jgi:hypothetical protein
MRKTIILLGLIIIYTSANAQLQNSLWKEISENEVSITGKRDIVPEKYKIYHLDINSIKGLLASAPLDKNIPVEHSSVVITIPMPDGTLQNFKVTESPVMEDALQISYPNIRTYNVKGIDDKYASGKLDLTEYGFHGMIRSPLGSFYIDPYCKWNLNDYISYYVTDFTKPIHERGICEGVIENTNSSDGQNSSKTAGTNAICAGANLKTYRLAVGCTGEYARAACGTGTNTPTTSQILSAVVTTINRVDGVYETEVSVKLVLVATTTLVLYGVPGTGYTTAENNNANSLIVKSQSLITSQIGTSNFDIGHTFSTGGGGLAGLGVVCNSSQKAGGITGSANPVGDPYDIDYVAHEIGHQFRGNHTFRASTNSCSGNGNLSTSVEPGSGVTIMAYAGICGSTNNLEPHSIAYFHAISYDEITNFITTGGGNSCDVLTPSGNNPPTVMVSGNIVTAPNTPFTLTGSATDIDGDSLTYQWEETDAGASFASWNAGTKPFFRSYDPVISPSRSFPLASVISSGNLQGTKGEFVPTTAQILKFRLTARDNKMGGGGVCSATTQVTVLNFSVTSQSTAGITYPSGSTQSITWNTNNTDLSPINCASVSIYVSTNSGTTYSLVLANTPNDGSENVVLPSVTTTTNTCRVKVASSSNVFFDINDVNFTISNTTGLNQYSNSNNFNIQLYPNPFSGSVKIDINATSGLDENKTVINVYDILGNIVKTENIKLTENFSRTYDFSSLANGTYIVVVTDGKQKSVARLIKM